MGFMQSKKLGLGFLVVSLTVFTGARSFGDPLDVAVTDDVVVSAKTTQAAILAALGDSITAGFLAFTYLDWFNPKSSGSEILASPDSTETSMLSLPVALLESRNGYSWATGKDISSQYVLLKNYLKQKEPTVNLSNVNLAKTGGLTSDVANQAVQLATLVAQKHYVVQYITLLIGANDTCQGVSDQVMLANLHQTFETLSQIKQSEPIRIIMSGLPRIPDVGLPAIKNLHTLGHYTCDQFRKEVTHECVALGTWTTTADYENLISLVEHKNAILAQAAQLAQAQYPNLEIVFSDQLFQNPLNMEMLALDCFHPNGGAQQTISKTLWQTQPWFH